MSAGRLREQDLPGARQRVGEIVLVTHERICEMRHGESPKGEAMLVGRCPTESAPPRSRYLGEVLAWLRLGRRHTLHPSILRGLRLIGVNSDNEPDAPDRIWKRLRSDLHPNNYLT